MFKRIIASAMAVTLCMSAAPIAKNISNSDIDFGTITVSAATVNYTKSFPKGTVLYTDAGSGKVSQTLTAAGTFTIVKEKTVSGVTYGKFKSGAGWAVLSVNVIPTDILTVCTKYNYASGRYWIAATANRRLSSCQNAAPSSANVKGYASYSYLNASQSEGFANYVMANVISNKIGKKVELPEHSNWAMNSSYNGFKKYPAVSVTNLKVGDIVCAKGMNGLSGKHSAVVCSVSASSVTFLECMDTTGQIQRSSKFSGYTCSLNDFKKLNLAYIIRYEG